MRQAHFMKVSDPDVAGPLAETGLMHLRESALSIPRPDLDWSYLDNWDEGKLSLQYVQAVYCGAYPPFCLLAMG
jgi:hypothetical protein